MVQLFAAIAALGLAIFATPFVIAWVYFIIHLL